MTREKAIEILINDGWNEIGATEIVDTLEDDGLLDEMTEKDILNISEDYKDR